ncbi:MAG TPA: hypothetical protein VMT94_04970 [Burkholderiales bacterium]|nr:hypothetical protein [Burkholderiales bacterium]
MSDDPFPFHRAMDDVLTALRPAFPECVWPVLPSQAGALSLAIQFQLERSQWWPPGKLRQTQFGQLALLLRHAHANVPLYRERWTQCGYRPDATLTEELFAALPLLVRADLQQHFDELKARQVPAAHGAASEDRTSGSTGTPVIFLKTGLTYLYWQAATLREHLWHRRDFSGALAVIRSQSRPGSYAGWGPSTDAAFRTGPSHVLDITTDVDSQLDWLAQKNPDYLLTLATNAGALAQRSLERGVKPLRLREVRVFGETLPSDLRALVREAWGVPVVDCYSASEIDYLALQCPEFEHYHVQSEQNLVEVLDEDGRPCAPGQTGRVVVSTLHNFALPLIRYEIGDYAEVGEPCPCGRGLPVLRRVLGRSRNMLMLPDGRRLWPSFPSSLWAPLAPLRQLQLVQHARDRIEARFVSPRELTADEAARLIVAFQQCLTYPFSIALKRVEAVERTPGGKYEDFICRIGAEPLA